MKKLFVLFFAAVIVAFLFSSCSATKRDCRGVKHYRLSNGIYL
ncbi:MAG TPA: hypothetical protein VG676_05785 [Chitinophagaceae bacterium]|nr:hypothetical protein [Chitinophagaceae bacterium]